MKIPNSVEFSDLGPELQYFSLLQQGRFALQYSETTGEYVHYPRVVAPRTGATDLKWVDASGKGTVYATTVLRRPPKYGGDYNVALIELEEGPRMLARVIGITPDEVKIGMAVQASIEAVDFGRFAESDQPLVVFRPANNTGAARGN